MREIKFRAWDGKRMQFMGHGGCYDFIIEGGCVSVFSDYSHDRHQKVWPLMQYTGLKDSEGVKIYEGDVLRWPGTNSNFHVVYSEQNGAFFYEDLKHGGLMGMAGISKSGKIIGNVYQNPELLEVSK